MSGTNELAFMKTKNQNLTSQNDRFTQRGCPNYPLLTHHSSLATHH